MEPLVVVGGGYQSNFGGGSDGDARSLGRIRSSVVRDDVNTIVGRHRFQLQVNGAIGSIHFIVRLNGKQPNVSWSKDMGNVATKSMIKFQVRHIESMFCFLNILFFSQFDRTHRAGSQVEMERKEYSQSEEQNDTSNKTYNDRYVMG